MFRRGHVGYRSDWRIGEKGTAHVIKAPLLLFMRAPRLGVNSTGARGFQQGGRHR